MYTHICTCEYVCVNVSIFVGVFIYLCCSVILLFPLNREILEAFPVPA